MFWKVRSSSEKKCCLICGLNVQSSKTDLAESGTIFNDRSVFKEARRFFEKSVLPSSWESLSKIPRHLGLLQRHVSARNWTPAACVTGGHSTKNLASQMLIWLLRTSTVPTCFAVFRIRSQWIRKVLGIPDLDPLVRGTDPDPKPELDPFHYQAKFVRKLFFLLL